jgi:hypothetical protein
VKAKAAERAALAEFEAALLYLQAWTGSLVSRHQRDMNEWAR